jgi:Tfp pilus assembly protein PilF/tRNA A-37 threonylcarbamoyl transferase component Bud32
MSRAGPVADRNLLFGILAVQMDFISRDALIAAMNAWVLAKHRPLGELLLEQGALTPERCELLEAMAAEHLKVHGNDPQRSLAAVARASTLEGALNGVVDPDLQATLAVVVGKPATTDPRPAPDGPRFHVLRPHATGGLGMVSVARDAELGREVALKELQASCAEDAASRDRFVREAEITGGLEHPGVVPVYGLGRHSDGRPYYAMRFVRGETLQEALGKLHAGKAGYTLRGLMTRFVAICNAVAYAHSRGVIHRDLKPANIMLGPYGETLVVDWGLAKVVGRPSEPAATARAPEGTLQITGRDAAATHAGSLLGTPAYMSPEQARGDIDTLRQATDVYSLGATLYTVLTGRAPVQGDEAVAMLERVWSGDWPPPRQVRPSVPRALDAVCRKAMAMKPGDRYGSALDLASDVERWLADEVVAAYREPWPVRLGRRARRHRTKVAAVAAAAVVALLLGGVGLAWLQQDQARRRAGAEVALQRVQELQSKAHWAEARAALEQAEDRLGEAGPDELRQRLVAARRDLMLVTRLDGLRLERASHIDRGGGYDNSATDQGYEAAFGEAGFGLPGDEPAAAAEKVAGSAVREVLLAALDDWALVASGKRRARALETARLADPDPWRDQLRDPAAWENDKTLAKLAREVPAENVTPGLAAAVGGRLMRAGEGEGVLRTAQAHRPGDFWLNLFLGWALNVKDKPVEAEGFTRAALAVRPDSPFANNDLGYILQRQDKLDEAAELFRRAVELNPKFTAANNNLASVLDRQGKLDEAVTVYRKLIELHPNYSVALVNLGWALDRQGKLDEAAAIFRKAVESDPKSSRALSNLGWVLDRQGKIDEAATLYRKAIELEPKLSVAVNNLGWVLDRQGKIDEAATLYRKAIELEPKLSIAANNLGCVLERQGKLDEAEAVYRKVIEDDPKNAAAFNNLGVLRNQQGKFDEAAALFRKVIEFDSKSAFGHANLADALIWQGKAVEAEVHCRKALELDPGDAAALTNLAEAALAQGKYRGAREAARHSLSVRPANDPGRAETEEALRLAGLSDRLSAVLRGDDRPANAAEGVDFAMLCRYQQRFADAARLYVGAFAAEAKVADDLRVGHRYRAACCAALASSGKGKGDPKPDDAERERWRRQALTWLRADLALWSRRLTGNTQEKVDVVLHLNHWLSNSSLVGVRDTATLAMPDPEQKEWQAFWAEVRALLAKSPVSK